MTQKARVSESLCVTAGDFLPVPGEVSSDYRSIAINTLAPHALSLAHVSHLQSAPTPETLPDHITPPALNCYRTYPGDIRLHLVINSQVCEISVLSMSQDLCSKRHILKITASLRAEPFVKYFSQCHLMPFTLNAITPQKHSVFNITHQETNWRSRLVNEMPKAELISSSLRPWANFVLNCILLYSI